MVLLSSEHTSVEINEKTKKPEIILTYNKAKGGIDHLDQMCIAYTSRKRTTRWPKCVFQHMIDVTAYNSFILWRETTGQMKVRRRQFLKMLGAELCGGQIDDKGNIKLIQKKTNVSVFLAKTGSRLRCRKCISNKTIQRCQECSSPLCINCASYKCLDC